MPIFQLMRHNDAACLRHSLHHQHAGHDGISREMSLKKRLIDGHIFQRDKTLLRLELRDPVDQQKRVAVRKKLQDLLDIKRHSLAPESAQIPPPALPEDYNEGTSALSPVRSQAFRSINSETQRLGATS